MLLSNHCEVVLGLFSNILFTKCAGIKLYLFNLFFLQNIKMKNKTSPFFYYFLIDPLPYFLFVLKYLIHSKDDFEEGKLY